MLKDEMKLKMLEPVFVIKNYVYGDNNCNYEKYLLELVNESLFFREKSNYAVYLHPSTEDNGECDCISDSYRLDFKLAEANSRLKAQNLLSMQYETIIPGVRSTILPKSPSTQLTVTNFHAVLRSYTMEQLEELLLFNVKFGSYEYDIKCYLENLKMNKNLFFFFPYVFFFDSKYNFKFAIENITKAIQNDFAESMKLRKKYCSDYDTFLAYIYDNNLVVLQLIEDGYFKIVDVIYLFKSKTFKYLYNTYFL